MSKEFPDFYEKPKLLEDCDKEELVSMLKTITAYAIELNVMNDETLSAEMSGLKHVILPDTMRILNAHRDKRILKVRPNNALATVIYYDE